MQAIHNYPNYTIDEQGLVRNIKSGRVLTPVIKNGYYGVRLSKDGRVSYKSVHILVYEAYKGARQPGMHVDHIDGIRTNNHVGNLRLLTPQANNQNRKHLVRGENVNTAKLSERDVMEIRRRKSLGDRTSDVASDYGICISAVRRVVTGKTWSHLPLLPVDNSLWGDPKKTGAISGNMLREKYGKEYFSSIAKAKKFKTHCATCACSS